MHQENGSEVVRESAAGHLRSVKQGEELIDTMHNSTGQGVADHVASHGLQALHRPAKVI